MSIMSTKGLTRHRLDKNLGWNIAPAKATSWVEIGYSVCDHATDDVDVTLPTPQVSKARI
jgi:hypothetical protein